MAGDPADLSKAVGALLLADVPGGTSITRPEVMTSYLCAYDYVRGASLAELPQATRDQIESRLVAETQSLASGFTDSNAKGKIGGTRALAGVLLVHQGLLNQGLGDLQNHFDYSTTDDGWFTDSQGHYLNYTVSHLGPFARAYEQGSGIDLYPSFAPYAGMSIGMRTPSGAMPNVSNGLNTPVAVHLFSQSPDPGVAAGVVWNVLALDPAPYNWSNTNVVNNDWVFTNLFALTDFNDAPAAAPSDSPTYFSPGQAKVSVFRQDWGPDSDWLMLSPGVDSPSGLFGLPAFHSHNDTMEVLLCARGEYLLVAPGYNRTDLPGSPPGFTPQLASWHNVVLVDGDVGAFDQGRKMRPEDFTRTDRLDSRELGGFAGVCDFVTLATDYRSTDVARSVAFPGEDYFVVWDRMDASGSHTYGFNLVGRGAQTVLANTAARAEVRWDFGGRFVVETLFATAGLSLTTGDLDMHDTFGSYEPTRRMTGSQVGVDEAFLSVLETGLAAGGPELAVAELDAGPGALAAGVASGVGGWSDTLLAQAEPGIRSAGPLASDARFAYLREQGGALQAALLVGGTVLAHGGALVVETDAPVTLSLLREPAGWRGTLGGDGFAPGTVLRLYGGGPVLGATLSGAPLAFTGGDTFQSVVLDGPPGELLIQLGPAPPCGYATYGYGGSPVNALRLTGMGATTPGSFPQASTEGVPGPTATLVASLAPGAGPALGGEVLVDPGLIVLIATAPAVAGVALHPLAVPDTVGLVGLSAFLQAVAPDPSQPAGWQLSQGLELPICP